MNLKEVEEPNKVMQEIKLFKVISVKYT